MKTFASITNLTIDNNVLYKRITGDDSIVVGSNTYTCNNGSYTTYNVNGSCNQPILSNYTEGSFGDYHLTSGDTVAKNMGAALGSPYDIDKDGIIRPQGIFWDIGAYEYIVSGPLPDTTPPAAPINLQVQ